MAKLTIEEKDQLDDLIHSDGIKALWKEAESTLQLFYKRVLEYNLDHTNQNEFVILKAQADGAAKLLLALKQRLDKSKLHNK